MNQDDLTPKQQEVLRLLTDSDARTIMATGGPGSGKTTLALWAARIFLESRDAPKRALFLTFSRAAVAQIASRCRTVLSGMEDRVEISTFHGLAFRIISGFGRYAGLGTGPVSIQSETRIKLFERQEGQFIYKELVPTAIELLVKSSRIGSLLGSRWGVVIVDEVQDTNPEQWDFLQLLRPDKLLMLGDPGQMIYAGFVPDVSPEHFAWLRDSADAVVELEERSHRDPTGVIPALATAVRRREFGSEAVSAALSSGRLVIEKHVALEDVPGVVGRHIKEGLVDGARAISVFVHSNAAVAELADALQELGIDHDLVGIPEAHAEALSTMRALIRYAAHLGSEQEVRAAFAVFLTSVVRGGVPELAFGFLHRDGSELPPLIEEELSALLIDLEKGHGERFDHVVDTVAKAWGRLRITRGRRPWSRAARHFIRMSRQFSTRVVSDDELMEFELTVERSMTAALIDLDEPEPRGISLMNYHQTKGREADIIIHVYRSDDYFGGENEPFRRGSRLLNVAVSRARRKVVVVLPQDPHPLVEPFESL